MKNNNSTKKDKYILSVNDEVHDKLFSSISDAETSAELYCEEGGCDTVAIVYKITAVSKFKTGVVKVKI